MAGLDEGVVGATFFKVDLDDGPATLSVNVTHEGLILDLVSEDGDVFATTCIQADELAEFVGHGGWQAHLWATVSCDRCNKDTRVLKRDIAEVYEGPWYAEDFVYLRCSAWPKEWHNSTAVHTTPDRG